MSVIQVFEGEHSPPVYNDLYNFLDGAQNDIFEGFYESIPDPAPNAPLPVQRQVSSPSTETSPTSRPSGSSSPQPTFLPSKACKPKKFPSSNAGLQRRGFEEESTGVLPRSWTGGAILGMTRRSRRLNPRESWRLWDMW